MPALLSSELPGAGQRPRARAAARRKLIAFRDTNGKVGLLENALPAPRRVALLRPQRRVRPALRLPRLEVRRRRQLHRHAQRARRERLQDQGQGDGLPVPGTRRDRLDLPGPAQRCPRRCRTSKANMLPRTRTSRRAFQLEGNWLQILEGDIDTTHVGFLHYGGLKPDDQPPGTFSDYQLRQKPAHFEVHRHAGRRGLRRRRPAAGPGVLAHRPVLLPVLHVHAARRAGREEEQRRARADGRLPHHELLHVSGRGMPPRRRTAPGRRASFPQLQPNTSDWYGRFRLEQTMANDFLIDREVQRTARATGYTGINGMRHAGRGHDRQHGPDHGSQPGAPRQHRCDGHPRPPAPDRRRQGAPALRRRHRPAWTIPRSTASAPAACSCPTDADWVGVTRELRRAFVEHRSWIPRSTARSRRLVSGRKSMFMPVCSPVVEA